MINNQTRAGWFLKGLLPGLGLVARIPVHTFPFVIGRKPDASLRLAAKAISWAHAEIFDAGNAIWLRDLSSTNGTWVNGERLRGQAPLGEGDLIQFASLEFRVGLMEDEARSRTATMDNPVSGPDGGDSGSPRLLRAMLRDGAVEAVFQPIIDCGTGRTVGYEALGRAHYPGLPRTASKLLAIAESIGLEVELSRLFRREAVLRAVPLPAGTMVFLNTHPAELSVTSLVPELVELRRINPSSHLVLEIHESAVTDPGELRTLAGRLADAGIAVAYDDFGVGQARLADLADAPPKFVKFDRSLIQGLDLKEGRRQQVVSGLVRVAREAGVVPLAEGVETAGEARICRELGFELGQGFFYGRPSSSLPGVRRTPV